MTCCVHLCYEDLYEFQNEEPDKATRGGEWEQLKIPRGNLGYVPNRTQHASLQLDQDHIAIEELTALGIGLGPEIRAEAHDGSSKSTTHKSTNKSRE
jgi:hypothetical protein